MSFSGSIAIRRSDKSWKRVLTSLVTLAAWTIEPGSSVAASGLAGAPKSTDLAPKTVLDPIVTGEFAGIASSADGSTSSSIVAPSNSWVIRVTLPISTPRERTLASASMTSPARSLRTVIGTRLSKARTNRSSDSAIITTMNSARPAPAMRLGTVSL